MIKGCNFVLIHKINIACFLGKFSTSGVALSGIVTVDGIGSVYKESAFFCYENKIRKTGKKRATAAAITVNCGNLRNKSRAHCLLCIDCAESLKRIGRFGKSHSRTVKNAYYGNSGFHGKIHERCDFFGMHLSDCSAHYRNILSINVYGSVVDQTVTCDYAIPGSATSLRIKIGISFSNQRTDFNEAVFVKQGSYTIPG